MKRYFNAALVLVFAILYLNTAYAGTVSARAGWVVQSGSFVGDVAGPNTTTALAQYADTAVEDKGSVIAFTSLGSASGGGYIKVRGILKASNRFEIDDLVLSYIGTEVARDAVRGDVHLTYSAAVGGESGAANLKLGLDLGAGTGGFRNTHFLDFHEPIGGVISESRNFTLGQIFTLKFIGELVVSSKLKVTPFGHRYYAGGSYSAFLGGSPVFNLPDGYVINSADGSIVNNYYTGLGAPSAVPVPAAIWLMGSGLIGLLGVRLKKT
jgi:hypothetical protein